MIQYRLDLRDAPIGDIRLGWRRHERRELAETGTVGGGTIAVALVWLAAGPVVLVSGLLAAVRLVMLPMILEQARIAGSHRRNDQ